MRTLLDPRRLAWLAAALAFAVAAVLLGNWQFSRHQDRLAERDLVEVHYGADPVPLSTVLAGPRTPLTAGQEWTHVEVAGRYLDSAQLLVRNRPHRGVYGYAVAVPFVPQGADGALLVDRGWVQNAADAATLPEVPSAPAGTVRITGWLRPGEVDLGRVLPAGQLASLDLAEASKRTGLELFSAYLVLDAEVAPGGSTPARPAPADLPDTGLGSHFAYALQWWLTAPAGVILVLMMIRREARESQPAHQRAPARPGRTRIWDEEDG